VIAKRLSTKIGETLTECGLSRNKWKIGGGGRGLVFFLASCVPQSSQDWSLPFGLSRRITGGGVMVIDRSRGRGVGVFVMGGARKWSFWMGLLAALEVDHHLL
jgi:hypothetical protein